MRKNADPHERVLIHLAESQSSFGLGSREAAIPERFDLVERALGNVAGRDQDLFTKRARNASRTNFSRPEPTYRSPLAPAHAGAESDRVRSYRFRYFTCCGLTGITRDRTPPPTHFL